MVKFWVLMQGQMRLGVLMPHGADWPWVVCHFAAQPEFEAIRPLFTEEQRIAEALSQSDEGWERWEQAYEAITRLGLTLVADTGTVLEEFLLHIVDKDAWFRF